MENGRVLSDQASSQNQVVTFSQEWHFYKPCLPYNLNSITFFVRQFDFAVIKQEFFLYVGAFFDKIIDCSLELRYINVHKNAQLSRGLTILKSLKSKS